MEYWKYAVSDTIFRQKYFKNINIKNYHFIIIIKTKYWKYTVYEKCGKILKKNTDNEKKIR